MVEQQKPTTPELLYLHEHSGQSFCRPCLRTLAQEEQPNVPAEIKSVKAAPLVAGRAYLEGPAICSNCGRGATALRSDRRHWRITLKDSKGKSIRSHTGTSRADDLRPSHGCMSQPATACPIPPLH